MTKTVLKKDYILLHKKALIISKVRIKLNKTNGQWLRNLVLSGLGTISISLDLSETFSGIGAANEIYIKIQFRKV